MIHNQSCVNGILAAVLSASVIPLHGALAREKSARLQKAIARHRPASLPERDAAKPVAPAAGPGPSAAQ
jgi:hypothetical protein